MLIKDLIELPEGVQPGDFVMRRHHAKSLGYDALVLFLDGLVLRLASFASDPTFVAREGQKLANLVVRIPDPGSRIPIEMFPVSTPDSAPASVPPPRR